MQFIANSTFHSNRNHMLKIHRSQHLSPLTIPSNHHILPIFKVYLILLPQNLKRHSYQAEETGMMAEGPATRTDLFYTVEVHTKNRNQEQHRSTSTCKSINPVPPFQPQAQTLSKRLYQFILAIKAQ